MVTQFNRLTFAEHQLNQREIADFIQLIAKAQKALEQAQTKQAMYYNIRRKELKIIIGDKVLVETHVPSSATRDISTKFALK